MKKGKEKKNKEPESPDEGCKKCEEYLAGWQRSKADYQNLQRETVKKMTDFRKYAEEDLLQQIFPLVDYFKHAFKKVSKEEKDSSWLQGIKHIQDYLNKILTENGVEEIKTVGQEADPELHEVVKGKQGKIIEEVETGFKLNNKIIKPAKVILADK